MGISFSRIGSHDGVVQSKRGLINTMEEILSLSLDTLTEGIPFICLGKEHEFVQRCVFMLDRYNHQSGVVLSFSRDNPVEAKKYNLLWSLLPSEQLKRSNSDVWKSTERSAEAIAFLIIRECTKYTAIEESARGNGIDYYLCEQDDPSWRSCAKLEVSGIGEGSTGSIANRINEKKKRLHPSDPTKVFIVVVEHSTPSVVMAVVNS